MDKRTSTAFNKKIYLLGADADGTLYWLEEGKWNCNWYWGFGYVESYTNNKNPHLARDIESHQHVDSSLLGDKNAKDGGYCHNIHDARLLASPTFTEEEGWELSELFQQFYFLREAAEVLGRGKCNTANTTLPAFKKPELVKEINRERIPAVMARIYEILSPRA